MTFLSFGKVTGVLPAPPANVAYLKLVHKILIAPDPQATGYVSVAQGGVTVRTFNKPAATGSNDEVFAELCGHDNSVDPTQFSIVPTVAGEGAFVTYLLK